MWKPSRPALAKIWSMIETHPYRSVVLLRLVLWFNPPLSYALAFVKMPAVAAGQLCAISRGQFRP